MVPLFDLLSGLKPDVCRGLGSGRAGVAFPVPTGRAAVVGGLDMLSSVLPPCGALPVAFGSACGDLQQSGKLVRVLG